jgi:thiosulfate dehydrogenase (quinone) large subunit
MTRRSLLIALMGASGVAAATAVAQQRATPNPQDKLALADRDMLPTEKTTDRNLAYLSLRVFLGINIAVHGASRIHSGVAGFATELVSQFAKTPLPSRMVYSFGVTLPFAEALVGVLIFIGLWSRLTYSAGFLLMIALTFGSTLRQDWTAAGWQLLYAFAYAALLTFREHNRYSVDGAKAKSEKWLDRETR